MQRLSFSLALFILLISGCSTIDQEPETDYRDYPIVDWYPVNLIVTVQDKQGNDLLDPARSGNYFEGTTISFKGTTYDARLLEAGEYWAKAPTKAYFAKMKGLRLVHDQLYFSETEIRTCYFLVFGQIDGAADMDENLVITWPNGKQDTFHYHCSDHKIEKQKDGSWDIDCQRYWKLNNKKASNPFSLVK